MPAPPRCVIYCRVSTDAQERDGTSLVTQAAACRDYASQRGWEIAATFEDTASGFRLDRPGLDEVRRLTAAGGADVVVAHALDRLSRKQTHVAILVEEMEERGVQLDFVTEDFEDTSVGQLVRSVKAFAAEFEREKIAERTMRGKLARARAGQLPQGTGAGCYGYVYVPATGRREIAPEQAAVVQEIFERFAAGASCHGLAVMLNERGLPAFRGGKWYAPTIRRMLANPAYCGRTWYRRTRATGGPRRASKREERPLDEHIEIPEATPALVSRDLYTQVQAILDDPARKERGKPTWEYPLRGRLRCGACGGRMVGQALGQGRYRYYRCRRAFGKARTCASRYIRTDRLEPAVLDAIAAVLADPERVLAEARRALGGTDAGARTRMERDLQRVEREQERLLRAYTAGHLPTELLDTEGARLSATRQRLLDGLSELREDDRIDWAGLERELPAVVDRVRDWVCTAEGEDRRLVLEAVQAEVVATAEEAEVRGVLPVSQMETGADLVTIEQTSA